MELGGKKVGVVGLARSGIAATNFLLAQGAAVTVVDSKPAAALSGALEQLAGRVETRLGPHRDDALSDMELVVLSPGVPPEITPVRKARGQGIPIWSEVELAWRYLPGRFVGVTGSNGKTTTTALLAAILTSSGFDAVAAGNIGTPLSRFLLEREPSDERVYVVELSSFQLETIDAFRCEVGLLLNLSPDHQDRYPDVESYYGAKLRLFLNQQSTDFAVVRADLAERVAQVTRARIVPFSPVPLDGDGAEVEGDLIRVRLDGRERRLMKVSEVPLKGRHNLENVLAALLAARLMGAAPDRLRRGVRSFRGVEHRIEFVSEIDGVRYYNDSKATNVDSTARAFESFDQPIVAIMGGLDKGGDFSTLRRLVQERVKALVLIGKASEKLEAALGDCAVTRRAGDLREAVALAAGMAKSGEVVLLSPACASFDMFADFEDRGRTFKRLVRELQKRPVVSNGRGNHQ